MTIETNQPPGFGQASKGGAVVANRDTELLEKSLLRSLASLLDVTSSALYMTDGSRGLLRARLFHRTPAANPAAQATEQFEELTDLSDASPELVSLTENVRLTSKPSTASFGDEWLVAYPLFACGELAGCLVFQFGREISKTEDAGIAALADVFANYHLMLDCAHRDRLTGLFNRDQMWTALSRPDFLVAKKGNGRRNVAGAPNWLAVIDVDQFKEICDTRGQFVADEVVQIVSHIMTTTFRSSDLLYRYRGEEFVVIIAAESEAIAMNVFERLRSAVEAHTFSHVEQITVSIGYCRADPEVLPLEVLSRADRSLHQAKLDGLNRCYEYHELVKSGVLPEE